MFQSPELISRIQSVSMGLTGVMGLIYAGLVLATGKPEPISMWWPATFGLATALIIGISFVVAGSRVAGMATDELFNTQDNRAHRIGYWTALFLYPIFGYLIAQGYVAINLAFVAMAGLTAAAYMIPFAVLTGGRS
ncbi:MAG: hypothetical protein L3J32_03830 [Rhizobiaceae bacterium]|nr:hypothetical protein [Rhizobiaceae bacterium]